MPIPRYVVSYTAAAFSVPPLRERESTFSNSPFFLSFFRLLVWSSRLVTHFCTRARACVVRGCRFVVVVRFGRAFSFVRWPLISDLARERSSPSPPFQPRDKTCIGMFPYFGKFPLFIAHTCINSRVIGLQGIQRTRENWFRTHTHGGSFRYILLSLCFYRMRTYIYSFPLSNITL